MGHTPGPWHIGFRSGHNGRLIMAYDGIDQHRDTCICAVEGLYMHKDIEEMRGDKRLTTYLANARLIAAAPKMAAFLERECKNCKGYRSDLCMEAVQCEIRDIRDEIEGRP